MVGAMDSSLKFALTALWNLTDEMPDAARSFIECRGLELYQEVLEVREQADKRSSEKHRCEHFPLTVARFCVLTVVLRRTFDSAENSGSSGGF